MKKLLYKIKVLMAVTVVAAALTSCAGKPSLTRYDAQFLQLFDTVTSIVGYAEDQETFTAYVEKFRDELKVYHQLYDIYNDYEGINNLKTINDNAGMKPVQVDPKIIEMLLFAVEMDEKTNGQMNVAMGSVLSIWHDYRTEGIDNPNEAKLPSMELLEEANDYTNIQDVVIDQDASTVFLPDGRMSLDVGAVAKGYATEQVSKQLEAEGFHQALISVGGNIRAIGKKDDGSKWSVGIQNPDTSSDIKYIQNILISDMSLVTSGSYQRYYTVGNTRYHHIINPDTLMPWDKYASVSILCKDSGMADALSTAIFNMEVEEGKALIESMDEVEALWIFPDKKEVYSSGFQAYLK